jgi:hypothetical protein
MADTRRCVKVTKQGRSCPIYPMYKHPGGDWFCHVHANRVKCQHEDGRPRLTKKRWCVARPSR